jgi:recombination protein RecR
MYEGAIQDLIDELGRLPGVGPKSAQRIAFHLLAAEPVDVERLAATLIRVKNEVKFCTICGNVAQADVCRICNDVRRDPAIICVVEEPKDVVAIERTREFRGRYHVLGGAISPIDGVGPDDLRIRELLGRLQDGTVTELILATDPNLEGEATATTSFGSSTTQMTVRSRRGSSQMRQMSASETLPQIVQNLTSFFTRIRTAARRSTSVSSAASRWNAMRCALFGPTPGSRPSSSMRS